MARQTGIIKLKGKIGDLSFYKTKDGHLAREKGGVDGDRIKNDPAFIRTRENGAEFGSSASSGKLLRDTIRPLMMRASHGRVTSTMTTPLTTLKNEDTTSARGQRNVATALTDNPTSIQYLNGFNFNNRSILGSVLYKPVNVDEPAGEFEIENLVPINDIAAPAGATHFSFTGGWADIDFDSTDRELVLTNTFNGPLDAVSTNVILTSGTPPAVGGTQLYLLLLEFFQEVNGVQYSLKNGAYNCLSVVQVA